MNCDKNFIMYTKMYHDSVRKKNAQQNCNCTNLFFNPFYLESGHDVVFVFKLLYILCFFFFPSYFSVVFSLSERRKMMMQRNFILWLRSGFYFVYFACLFAFSKKKNCSCNQFWNCLYLLS